MNYPRVMGSTAMKLWAVRCVLTISVFKAPDF